MVLCLSLTERAENSAALRGIFSKWWRDLVISEPCGRINVNLHESRYTARKRLLVKETWNSSVHRHDACCLVVFVTGRDRDISWCVCSGGCEGLTEPRGSKNRARHFYGIVNYRDVTLKGLTVRFLFIAFRFWNFSGALSTILVGPLFLPTMFWWESSRRSLFMPVKMKVLTYAFTVASTVDYIPGWNMFTNFYFWVFFLEILITESVLLLWNPRSSVNTVRSKSCVTRRWIYYSDV